MTGLMDDPIYKSLFDARSEIQDLHHIQMAKIPEMVGEFGQNCVDLTREKLQAEHEMIVGELNKRIQRRIDDLANAEISSPIIGKTSTQSKENEMNETEAPYVMLPDWTEIKEKQDARKEARRMIWRGSKKAVKWTLIIAGTAAIIGHFVPDKDTTPIVEVK